MKWPCPGVPARQVPLGASLRSGAVLVRRDSPEPLDSQLEQEPRAEVQAEAVVAVREAREIAQEKSAQVRVSIGRQ